MVACCVPAVEGSSGPFSLLQRGERCWYQDPGLHVPNEWYWKRRRKGKGIHWPLKGHQDQLQVLMPLAGWVDTDHYISMCVCVCVCVLCVFYCLWCALCVCLWYVCVCSVCKHMCACVCACVWCFVCVRVCVCMCVCVWVGKCMHACVRTSFQAQTCVGDTLVPSWSLPGSLSGNPARFKISVGCNRNTLPQSHNKPENASK